jgi:hypothetical protein
VELDCGEAAVGQRLPWVCGATLIAWASEAKENQADPGAREGGVGGHSVVSPRTNGTQVT